MEEETAQTRNSYLKAEQAQRVVGADVVALAVAHAGLHERVDLPVRLDLLLIFAPPQLPNLVCSGFSQLL